MAYSVNPLVGVDLNNTITGVTVPPHKVGTQTWGDDGKRYVFAKASGAIAASTNVCTVNTSTFAASNTGGTYTSPATAMNTGDYGWFSAASV